jgi:hypothetical protein
MTGRSLVQISPNECGVPECDLGTSYIVLDLLQLSIHDKLLPKLPVHRINEYVAGITGKSLKSDRSSTDQLFSVCQLQKET